MVARQLVREHPVVVGADPVHAPVDDVGDGRVPRVVDGQQAVGLDDGRDVRRVLEAGEVVGVAVAHAEDQVARALGVGDALRGLVERGVELEDVADQEAKGVAARQVGLGPEGRVGVRDADLRDAELRRREAGDRRRVAGERQVGKGVAVARARRGVVHDDRVVVAKGPVDVPVEGAQLQQVAVGRRAVLGAEHRARAARQLAEPHEVAQLDLVDAAAGRQPPDLLHHVRLDVGRGHVVREVERGGQPVLQHLLERAAAEPVLVAPSVVGELRDELALKVKGHLGQKLLQLVREELAHGVAVLVRRAPHVHQVLDVARGPDAVELAVGDRPHEDRRRRVDGVEVGGARLGVAVAARGARRREEEREGQEARPHGSLPGRRPRCGRLRF